MKKQVSSFGIVGGAPKATFQPTAAVRRWKENGIGIDTVRRKLHHKGYAGARLSQLLKVFRDHIVDDGDAIVDAQPAPRTPNVKPSNCDTTPPTVQRNIASSIDGDDALIMDSPNAVHHDLVIQQQYLDVHRSSKAEAALMIHADGMKGKLVQVPIAGDGHCLFRSVAYQMVQGEQHHSALRQDVVSYVQCHLDEFKAFFPQQTTAEVTAWATRMGMLHFECLCSRIPSQRF